MSRSRFERHGYLESELKKEEADDDSWFQQYQEQRQREQSIGRSSAQPTNSGIHPISQSANISNLPSSHLPLASEEKKRRRRQLLVSRISKSKKTRTGNKIKRV
jgi:hypothetical protein